MPHPLERPAAGALPALEQVERSGWLLRCTPGSFKRSNSALALVDDPGPVEVVEAFYAERGQAARVQVSDERVDARLAGWERHDPVLVLSGPLPAGPHTGPGHLEVRPAPWEEWFDCWDAVDGRAGGRATTAAQLALVRQPSAYVGVSVDGQVVGAGRGALGDGWLGVFGMVVLPGHRGEGTGRALLHGLGRWGAAAGAHGAYLQVLEDNAPARGLYAAAGLTPAYTYWYRTGR